MDSWGIYKEAITQWTTRFRWFFCPPIEFILIDSIRFVLILILVLLLLGKLKPHDYIPETTISAWVDRTSERSAGAT